MHLLRLAAAPWPLPTALAGDCPQRLARMRAQLAYQTKPPTPPPLPLTPGSCEAHSQRGLARVRGIQGTRAGERKSTADDRIRDAERRPAAMPTESISTLSIALVTADREAHLLDLKRMI